MSTLSSFRSSLAPRLALVFGCVSLVVVVIMGFGVTLLTGRYLEKRTEDELAALADFYAIYTVSTASDEVRLTALAPQIVQFFAPQAGYDVRLFGARNGALLAATCDMGPLPSSAALAELGHGRPSVFLAASQDQPDRLYAARAVTAADGRSLAVVEVSRSSGEIRSFLSLLRLIVVGAGGLALVIALGASLILARWLVRPLGEMEAATQAIAAGDFGRRVTPTSDDEIGRLASSINRMAADLASLEAARREFIAKVSHDLRTPLTAIKGFVVNLQDTAPDEMRPTLATMDEQTERLVRLVNDLLTLSRLQRGELRLQMAQIDLADVARAAASLVGEKARRVGVTLVLDVADSLPMVTADADRLQQVVVNLLDNAIRFTSPGGLVSLRAETGAGTVRLLVTDEGRGLTEEEAKRAFEPYFHGPGGGAGLGLSIAREIISAHRGHIWLQARPEGGAEAGFSLPCLP